MPRRAASPAASEPELDIFDSLSGEPKHGQQGRSVGAEDFDFDGLINDQNGADDGGDEAFIALQQAASYRKASNLKGRTVKKGGGFQAMGAHFSQIASINANAVVRSQCKLVKSHYTKGVLCPHADPAKNYPPSSR